MLSSKGSLDNTTNKMPVNGRTIGQYNPTLTNNQPPPIITITQPMQNHTTVNNSINSDDDSSDDEDVDESHLGQIVRTIYASISKNSVVASGTNTFTLEPFAYDITGELREEFIPDDYDTTIPINICLYAINESVPDNVFLQYLLYLNKDEYIFPSFVYDHQYGADHDAFESACKEQVYEIVQYEPDATTHTTIDNFAVFQGILKHNDQLYVFIKINNSETKLTTTFHSWAIIHEIINEKKIIRNKINSTVTELFTSHPNLIYIRDMDNIPINIPYMLYGLTTQTTLSQLATQKEKEIKNDKEEVKEEIKNDKEEVKDEKEKEKEKGGGSILGDLYSSFSSSSSSSPSLPNYTTISNPSVLMIPRINTSFGYYYFFSNDLMPNDPPNIPRFVVFIDYTLYLIGNDQDMQTFFKLNTNNNDVNKTFSSIYFQINNRPIWGVRTIDNYINFVG